MYVGHSWSKQADTHTFVMQSTLCEVYSNLACSIALANCDDEYSPFSTNKQLLFTCRWMFFPPEDIPYLYPLYNHSTDAVFEVSLGNPDLHLHPLLCLTHPRECILQPGEVLFVPAGCPHRVENLEKSLAISANFVDLSNFEAVCKELKVNALVDERAEQLLKIFESKEFSCEVDEQQQILPWKEFKTWPRTVQTSLKLPPSTNEKVI